MHREDTNVVENPRTRNRKQDHETELPVRTYVLRTLHIMCFSLPGINHPSGRIARSNPSRFTLQGTLP